MLMFFSILILTLETNAAQSVLISRGAANAAQSVLISRGAANAAQSVLISRGAAHYVPIFPEAALWRHAEFAQVMETWKSHGILK